MATLFRQIPLTLAQDEATAGKRLILFEVGTHEAQTVTVSKGGGAFGASDSAASQVEGTLYQLAVDADDLDTVGALAFKCAGETDTTYLLGLRVVAHDPYALAEPGAQMDLVDAPNATAIEAIIYDLPSAAQITDAVFDEALAGHTAAGTLGAALDPATANSLAQRLTILFHRFLTSAVATKDVDGNAELVIRDAVGGSVLRTVDLTRSGLVTSLEVQ